MKKLITMLLLAAMLVSVTACNTSDMEDTSQSSSQKTETTDTSASSNTENQQASFVHPADRERVYKEFIAQNEDLELKVIFEAYESENLGENAYFTRNENLAGHFYITNISDHSVYFYLHDPIELVGHTEPREFEIDLKTADGYTLDHLKGIQSANHVMTRIELKPGETFMKSSRFAAGEYVTGYYTDENGNDCYNDGGIRYYGEDAYQNRKMCFSGAIAFDYFATLEDAEASTEPKTISTDIALTCFYTLIDQ